MDTRLKTVHCKSINVAKSKEVKTGSNLGDFSKEGYGSKSAVLPTTTMMMMMMIF
jgi:hypothetical protein